MTRDYLKAGAMVAALVTMAPAEYHLAQGCGFGEYLAAGLPASLDIYTLRAIRTGRDVISAGAVMIAVNAASHLIAAGHLAVSWYLIVAVSALPILVLVRVERLGKTAGGTEAAEAEPAPELAETERNLHSVPAEPAPEPVVIERVSEPTRVGNNVPGFPTLGPMIPVAELLAGTGRDQAFPAITEKAEPAPERPRAEPEPAPDPAEPDEVPPGVAVEHVTLARLWLKTEPKLTGTAIGTKLGTSDSYGRRVRRAALAVTS